MAKLMHLNGPGIKRMLPLVAFIFLVGTQPALSDESTASVTTYVVRTQEERHDTRWTLTQWLRVKERMKLMDVWLAMFSDPKKDKFRPEFNVSVLATTSTLQRKVDGVLTDNGTGSGQSLKGQLWLTNLLSSQFGVRALNVDLGLEAGGRDSGILSPNRSDNAPTALSASIAADYPSAITNWYSLNLRLFGKHIQDSSLILKYGIIQTTNTIQLPNSNHTSESPKNWSAQYASGTFQGAELQLYLTNGLGLEGTAHHYVALKGAAADHTLTGTYGEGLLFIEISLFRFQAGMYEERWSGIWSDVRTTTKESGYVGGIKILL